MTTNPTPNADNPATNHNTINVFNPFDSPFAGVGSYVLDVTEADSLQRAAIAVLDAANPFEEPEKFLRLASLCATETIGHQLAELLHRFKYRQTPNSALLIRGLPTGRVPRTPADPMSTIAATIAASAVQAILLSRFGDQYGVQGESGGRILHSVLPVREHETEQISFSSLDYLKIHCESAFTPSRPRHVALFCLNSRPGQDVGTRVAAVQPAVAALNDETQNLLRQPRFETDVDLSIAGDTAGTARPVVGPMPVITGQGPRFRFRADFAETRGIDSQAQHALDAVHNELEARAHTIVLEPGDMVIVDNDRAVHGRCSFKAAYDGRDRWLLRGLVTPDVLSLPAAHGESPFVIEPTAGI